ncbi:calmodulin-regulated spectrin-associated protein 1-like isoform X2 [Ruditapes philippinarum]|uniref:calmodulin-regulated spectrin-associated protein 1-like isoform X2 n=1 Tax=Ruditapes philippinarum TaxID=129788 RepID=UPI00295BEF1E|nr:calmodulin-regulated spectrin-associated protein 1-like isoform X2 [Ruditapes philippinarum]
MDDLDSEVIEIIPMDEYDTYKAKAKASLSWILCKAYKDKVPTEFHDPFYSTSEGSWQIKPRLANLLATSELYCQACRTMFGENASQWTGHWSIIQVLSRKGIYAVGSDSVDVTETILMQSAPFKLKAHLALIDALMTAFSREIISIERVTQTVRRFATFNASSELPSDTEDAILFWVNKVCVTVQKNLESTVIEGGETSQKVRIISSKTQDSISVPIMESLVDDMSDGCSVASLISFYCPNILKIDDVCLKSNVGIADSLYNLRLIRSFCERHLPHKTWHFSYEDLLYTQQTIKLNIIMMISELFYWFEIKTLPIVTGGGFSQNAEHSDGQLHLSTAAKVPNVPISQVTKQSFQRLKGDSELRSSSSTEIHKMSPTTPVAKHAPLLHKRQQHHHAQFHDEDHSIQDSRPGVHRTGSLTTHDLKFSPSVPRQSVVAWPDKSGKDGAEPSKASSNLLSNVSIDSDMNASFSSGSIDLGDLDTSPRLNTERSQFEATESHDENVINFSLQNKKGTPFPNKQKTPFPEHLDLASVNSGAEFCVPSTGENQSHDYESAFHSPRGDYNENVHIIPVEGNLEPLMPARLKPAKEKINNHTKAEERDETPSASKVKKVVQIDPHFAVIDRSAMCDESTETITPVPDNDLFDTLRKSVIDDQSLSMFSPMTGIVNDDEEILTHRSDVTVAESYIVDHIKTPEAARAAGIPIIDDFNLTPRRLSREGSVASSKSSGEYSDHESHKIHFDHKTQETENKVNNNNDNLRKNENDFSDPGRFIIQKPVIMSRTLKDFDKGRKGNETNFAQIKQMKQFGNVDNSGFVYMQHGQEDGQRPSLKDSFHKKQQELKMTLGTASNQRTWQQNADSSVGQATQASTSGDATSDAASTELLKIKMKLEEKRKAIQRKKHTQEIQQQKMRQRLGKAAFLHVVAKPKDDSNVVPDNTGNIILPSRMINSDPSLPLSTITESSMTSSTTSSLSSSSSPVKSPAHLKNPRPVSRDDLQQTIENVRMKWFNDGDTTSNGRYEAQNESEYPEGHLSPNGDYVDELESEGPVIRRPVFDRRSTSVERVSVQNDQKPVNSEVSPRHGYDRQSVERSLIQNSVQQPVIDGRSIDDRHMSQPGYDRRSASVERPVAQNSLQQQDVGQSVIDRRSSSVDREGRRDSGNRAEKGESYDEYNHSLDKLNQSLSDLQGEIQRLSLKQKKPEQTSRDIDQRSRSKSPPTALDVRQKIMPERAKVHDERSRSAHPTHSQGRSSSEPRQIVPDYDSEQQIGNYQSQTLPRQTGYQQTQGQPFMMQNPASVAGPAGPVYGTPSHFIPGSNQPGIPPTAQQYGSYIMGPTTQQPIGHMHQPIPSPYQHSPPQVYPGAASMYPGQQFPPQPIISPQSQPYSAIYASPTHTQFQTFPPNLTGTYTTSAHQNLQYTPPGSQPLPFNTGNQQAFLQQQLLSQTGSQIPQQTQHSTVPTDILNRQTDNVIHDSSINKSETIITSQPSAKTQIDSDSVTTEHSQKTETSTNRYESPAVVNTDKDVTEQTRKPPQEEASFQSEPSSSMTTEDSKIAQQDTSVGFVIGQDETSLNQSVEEEMLKKKEKIERMRQKRQEEQERKKQRIEMEMLKKREAERAKQEEADRRKSDEKARREQIFKQYLVKKEEEEEGPKPKSKPKPRPKSMFVKGGPDQDLTDYESSVTATASNEDLSSKSVKAPPGGNKTSAFKGPRKLTPKSSRQSMRKAVSCHTLHNGNGESQNLAYGGLTHRRPPSPDIYRPRGQRSNESSEAGSAHGGEYSGPKLYVKPSAKSNRHIIINAISHCCLAGSVNTEQKNKVLEEVAKSSAKHFLILFRDASCGYRGLYGFDPDTEDCFKIVGVGPRSINNEMVEKYYKYNSGAKSFSQVASTKHISVSIDAVSLQNTVWKRNQPPPKGNKY